MMGPNTAHTHASPCYSMQGKSKHHSFAEDLAKVSRASLLSRRREGSGARCSPSSRRIPGAPALCGPSLPNRWFWWGEARRRY